MPLDWSPFVDFVHRHARFFLTTHVRPDGDGLGAMLALGEAMERLGKQVRRVIPSRLPPRYEFMDPGRSIEVFAGPGGAEFDALVVIDTGTWNQLADVAGYVRESRAEKVVIDHHRTQDDLGALRFVDVSAAATGAMMCDAIAALGVPLSPTMAQNLFVALAWDTGWFRHPNATATIYEVAGRLVGAGANPTTTYEELYDRKTLESFKLHGRVADRIELRADGRVAFSYVVFTDYAETGAVPLDTEDLINYPRSIAGVEIALMFMEQRDGTIKVSFRSRRADVGRIAEGFGGGGHRLAAGATLPGPMDAARQRVLAVVVGAIESAK